MHGVGFSLPSHRLSEMHILVVDDDPAVRLFLAEELRQYGYRVTEIGSGEEALMWLHQHQADVMVLDLKMSGIDGLQVMAELQKLPMPPAVVVLTAYASLDAAVTAMRWGGCDFLRKPCSTEELLAAIERGAARRREMLQRERMLRLIEEAARQLRAAPDAVKRDTPPPEPPRFLEGRGLLLDRERRMVTYRGKPIALSPVEFRLLDCLMARPDEPVSFREMLRHTHGTEESEAVARDTLHTPLWRLSRKLAQAAPEGTPFIVNVRGRGYMFVKEGPAGHN